MDFLPLADKSTNPAINQANYTWVSGPRSTLDSLVSLVVAKPLCLTDKFVYNSITENTVTVDSLTGHALIALVFVYRYCYRPNPAWIKIL